jgi:hypothetical protein
MSYFGIACDAIYDLSFEDLVNVQRIMKDALDKTMQDVEHEEPKFSNLVSWF